jgi:protein-S-isoprenylcysteine O-methyltransferase Ste14
MLVFIWVELLICWGVWLYPFVLRAPHNQKRSSITMAGPSQAGLFLESLAIALALILRLPDDSPAGLPRVIASIVFALVGIVLSWTAVAHLGKHFRVYAGLYADHQLVRSGPYAVVRHPIYAGLLAMLLCTISAVTRWPWAVLSLALFAVGTEIRVRTEDGLLESRFGDAFRDYQRRVPAYVPFLR